MSTEGNTAATRRGVLAGGAAAIASALAGCSAMTPFVGRRRERTERVEIEDAESLSASLGTGDLTIRTEDREDVRLDIVEKSSYAGADLDDLHLRTDRVDGELRLRSEYDGDEGLFGGSASMDVDAKIPRSLAVNELETSTGDVDVREVDGDVTASASTGGIDLRNVDGDVTASVSTGEVHLVDVSGTASADASTGEVTIRNPGRLGDVETSTGEIDVDAPAIDGDTTISASTGDVDLAIGADVDASFRATTSTGEVSVTGIELEDATIEDDLVVGTIGDGGPSLEVSTSTGDVTIAPLE